MKQSNPTATIDELQKVCDQAAGILTVVIEDDHIDASIKHALSAARDLVKKADTLGTELHHSSETPQN